MSKLSAIGLSVFAAVLFPGQALAGTYDGIWLEQGNPHCYWFVRDNAGTLVMAQLCNDANPGVYVGQWEVTLVGGLVGNVATVNWNAPTVSGRGTVTFSSPTMGAIRTDQCTLKPNAPPTDCDAAGSSVILTKYL